MPLLNRKFQPPAGVLVRDARFVKAEPYRTRINWYPLASRKLALLLKLPQNRSHRINVLPCKSQVVPIVDATTMKAALVESVVRQICCRILPLLPLQEMVLIKEMSIVDNLSLKRTYPARLVICISQASLTFVALRILSQIHQPLHPQRMLQFLLQ